MEAYAAMTDAQEAFRYLAEEAKVSGKVDDLRWLVDAHSKKHAKDSWLPFYQGEVLVQEGQFEDADKVFTAGMARPPLGLPVESFRYSRVLARYSIGQTLSAYAEIGPKNETFVQLAALCYQDQKDDHLQALLDEHAKTAPDHIEVWRYRYRLKLRQNLVKEAIALFKTMLSRKELQNDRERVVESFLMDMVDAGHALEGYAAAPDARRAFQHIANDLLDQFHMKELRQLVDAHRARLADDPWLPYFDAQILIEDREWDKAALMLREGLRRAPLENRNSLQSSYIFAMYKAGRGLNAYQEFPSKETFNHLASLCTQDRNGATLEALAQAYEPLAGDDPDLLFQKSRARVLTKQPEAAILLFQKALQKQPLEHQRRYYVSTFVADMFDQGQGWEAFRAVPDNHGAFEALAWQLVNRKKDKELEKLVAEHAAKHPDDPWRAFFAGEVCLMRGDLVEAEKLFAAALAKAPLNNQWTFRNSLNRTKIKAGKAALAFEEAGKSQQAFQDLAFQCVNEKSGLQLEALVAAYRRERRNDVHLRAWDVDVLWLKQDYEGALKVLDDNKELFAQPRHRWKIHNHHVRCLIQLKRHAEAIRIADGAFKKKQGNVMLVVLAHASTGNVQRLIAEMEQLTRDRFLIEDCYRDPDLGPLLRSPAFADFRARFPEPKGARVMDRD
jgi:predicted Zn-dependent protease